MRTIRLIILAIILLAIVILAIANLGLVTVNLLPSGLDYLMPGMNIQLPLFVVILAAVAAGLVIGYLFEYLREHKHRRLAARKIRETERLNREIDGLRRDTGKPKDDVLAILGN